MRQIKTNYVYPPIPIRTMDWVAWYDGDEEGPQAFGSTEAEAIQNLRDQDDTEMENP